MWNKSISLPAKRIRHQDSEGLAEDTYEFIKDIPANFTDTTREDEVLAAQKGYTADQNVEIMHCNYNGASFLVDDSDGQIYDIKRTYHKDKAMTLVMTCERRQCGEL